MITSLRRHITRIEAPESATKFRFEEREALQGFNEKYKGVIRCKTDEYNKFLYKKMLNYSRNWWCVVGPTIQAFVRYGVMSEDISVQ